jgi:hypothetical protein
MYLLSRHARNQGKRSHEEFSLPIFLTRVAAILILKGQNSATIER